MSTRIVIVRHGESQCTVDGVIGGDRGCTGLSEEGRRQAERLRDRLLRTGELAETDVVLTSVLPRAIETAELIAPGLGRAASLQAKQDCDLCELHPGEADGLTWDEYRDRYGQIDMRENPYQPLAPGGESLADFATRIGRAMHRILEEHEGQSVVVVAHGGVVWASARAFMNLPLRVRFALNADNTSITEWSVSEDYAELLRYNDFAHLQPSDG